MSTNSSFVLQLYELIRSKTDENTAKEAVTAVEGIIEVKHFWRKRLACAGIDRASAHQNQKQPVDTGMKKAQAGRLRQRKTSKKHYILFITLN